MVLYMIRLYESRICFGQEKVSGVQEWLWIHKRMPTIPPQFALRKFVELLVQEIRQLLGKCRVQFHELLKKLRPTMLSLQQCCRCTILGARYMIQSAIHNMHSNQTTTAIQIRTYCIAV